MLIMFFLPYFVIGLTYVGLGLGYLPGLRMNRATIAIAGAALLMALGVLDLKVAWAAIDYKTLVFLFGMMVISNGLAAAGFFQLEHLRFGLPLTLITLTLAYTWIMYAL